MLRLREPIHLRLDQSLFFVFIIDFAIIAFRVGEYITIVVDVRTSIRESDGLIPFITVRSGLRVDSFTELCN